MEYQGWGDEELDEPQDWFCRLDVPSALFLKTVHQEKVRMAREK